MTLSRCNDSAAGVPGGAGEAESAAAKKHSYGEILKSSTLIGGARIITILIGIVRTKAIAIMLGPAGFGLIGIYGSLADLARSVAEMGINSSGVRQIAEAVGSGDTERIARTVSVLRRTAAVLGLLGAILLIAFSVPLSVLTFGSEERAGAVALLGLAVLFRLIADGQGALIQGMRRIVDLTKMGVIGELFGTLLAILLVYYLGQHGVVPSLIAVAAMSIATSWWYSRKIKIQPPRMSLSEVRKEATSLLTLGFAFMVSGLLMMGAAYGVRTILLRMEGVEAAGFYQAAWTLGGLYVGIILQAMGTDFYPRLVAAACDDTNCNRLVNEQAQVSMLLAGPGVMATLTFAPLVISLFYSAEFVEAVGVLRWICLGIALRVITWPMGYIIVAKNKQLIFLCAEVAWAVVNVGLTWICVNAFGLAGAGIAFCGSYLFHGFMIYPIVRTVSGFRWSAANRRIGLLYFAAIAAVFCGVQVLPNLISAAFGILATILGALYSINILLGLISADIIPHLIRDLLARLGSSIR